MTWVRLDDQFADHAKMLKTGPLAIALQVRALCWSNRQLTDGFLPDSALPILLIEFDLYEEHDGRAQDWPQKMVDNGLWDVATGGYQIHDYLDWNRSKAQIVAERKAKAEAGQRGGRTAQANRQHVKRNGSRPAEHPVVADFLAVWTAYPRKEAKGDAEKAWRQTATLRPPVADLLAALTRAMQSEQWAKDGGQFIPRLGGWLRKHQWEDQMTPRKDAWKYE